jgi:hypothetical protein
MSRRHSTPTKNGYIIETQNELGGQYTTCPPDARAPYGKGGVGTLRTGDQAPCDYCTDVCDNNFILPSGCTLVS